MEGRPGAILGSPLFSESTIVSHLHSRCRFLINHLPLKRVTAQDSWMSIDLCLEALDHVIVFSFAVSPGTWPGGA